MSNKNYGVLTIGGGEVCVVWFPSKERAQIDFEYCQKQNHYDNVYLIQDITDEL